MLVALVTACQPFAVVEPEAPATDDLTDTPSAPSKVAAPTSTSTSPAMPKEITPPVDFCAGATFCETFEKSEKGNGLWQDFKAINGDVFARTAPSAGDGAFSLDIKVPAGAQSKHSALRREIGTFGHVETRFAIRIPTTFGANGHTNITHLDFGEAAEFDATIVGEQNQVGLVIKDDTREFQLINEIEVTPNTWHVVTLIIDLPGEPPTAHMDIDGTDVVKLETLATSFVGAPPVNLTFGPDYKTTTNAYEIRLDDLRIDARD